MTTRVRQFAVKHLATGLVTLVNYRQYKNADGYYRSDKVQASRLAGHRYPVDCDVTLVPMGDETACSMRLVCSMCSEQRDLRLSKTEMRCMQPQQCPRCGMRMWLEDVVLTQTVPTRYHSRVSGAA